MILSRRATLLFMASLKCFSNISSSSRMGAFIRSSGFAIVCLQMYAILGDYAYALAVFFFSISTSIPDLRLRPNSRCPYGFLNPLKKQGKDRPLTLDALAHWMLGSYNVTQNRGWYHSPVPQGPTYVWSCCFIQDRTEVSDDRP